MTGKGRNRDLEKPIQLKRDDPESVRHARSLVEELNYATRPRVLSGNGSSNALFIGLEIATPPRDTLMLIKARSKDNPAKRRWRTTSAVGFDPYVCMHTVNPALRKMFRSDWQLEPLSEHTHDMANRFAGYLSDKLRLKIVSTQPGVVPKEYSGLGMHIWLMRSAL